MSYNEALVTVTKPAGEDLSPYQFRMVKTNTSGQVVLADTLGERITGVLQNKPTAVGHEASISERGITKVIAAGAFDIDAELVVNSAGLATAKTAANQYIIGIAQEAATTANQVVAMKIVNYQATA